MFLVLRHTTRAGGTGASGVDELEARTVPSKGLAGLSELVGPGDKK